MINGIACFAYFNKIWGIPVDFVPFCFAGGDSALGEIALI
jgi:hypothetical protein